MKRMKKRRRNSNMQALLRLVNSDELDPLCGGLNFEAPTHACTRSSFTSALDNQFAGFMLLALSFFFENSLSLGKMVV